MRRLIVELDGQGNISLQHDSFTGPEYAAMALIVQEKAMDTLKNGPTGTVQISRPDNN